MRLSPIDFIIILVYLSSTIVIGLSPNEFIRSFRLKRAAQLLKKSQRNIDIHLPFRGNDYVLTAATYDGYGYSKLDSLRTNTEMPFRRQTSL